MDDGGVRGGWINNIELFRRVRVVLRLFWSSLDCWEFGKVRVLRWVMRSKYRVRS